MAVNKLLLLAGLSFLAGTIFGSAPVVAQTNPPATQCVTHALTGGTPDVITTARLPCVPTTTLLVLTLSGTNTISGVTLQPVGTVAQPVVRSDGTPLGVGELVDGGTILLVNNGAQWRKLAGAGTTVTGCGVSGGTEFRVLRDDGSGGCTDGTITNTASVISGTLSPTEGGWDPNSNVLRIDPGTGKIFLGILAGDNAVGNPITAIGENAGEDSNIQGDGVFIGREAGSSLTSPLYDFIAIGNSAGFQATLDSSNAVFIGAAAGQGSTFTTTDVNGNNIVAIGNLPCANNFVGYGSHHICIGYRAGNNNHSDNVVSIGNAAGFGGTGGNDLVMIGQSAGNDQGSFVVSIGFVAGSGNQGDEIIALGSHAVSIQNTDLTSGTPPSGDNVVGIGSFAGAQTTGSELIAIGNLAGYKNIGSNVIILSNDDPGNNALSNYMDLAETITVTGIDAPATSRATIAGRLVLPALTSAADCTGQPSGEIISTTGTGVLVQCP